MNGSQSNDPAHGRGAAVLLLGLWLLSGVMLVSFLGRPDVSRTQEARVLVTAREMLAGHDWRGWIVPHMMGRVRLAKPPLAYWLAAGGFKVFGVGEAAGRFPFALLAWLTVGLVYRAGRHLHGVLAGFFAAAALMGCYIFARHGRLAETDGPATLFVTAAIWWAWRAAQARDESRSATIDFHLAAAALALAFMSKQGTVAYPVLFIILGSLIERRWAWLLGWVKSGAIVTFAVLGLPWWITIARWVGTGTFYQELKDVTEGRDHNATVLAYVPQLIEAMAPWIGVVVLALVAAGRRWGDAKLRGLLAWCVAIVLPLCVAGNKQFHYLMPLAPPLALLMGWLLREQYRAAAGSGETKVYRAVLGATLLALLAAAVAVPVAAKRVRGSSGVGDYLVAGAIALVAVWGLLVFAKNANAAALLAVSATAIAVPLLVQGWLPTLAVHDHGTLAADIIAHARPGPYCFYGKNESLALGFALRAVVPSYDTQEELEAALAREPRLVVIAQTKNRVSPPPLPRGMRQVLEERVEDQVIRVYLAERSPSP